MRKQVIRMIKICKSCQKEYKVLPCKVDTQVFCSWSCKSESMKGSSGHWLGKAHKCVDCGKDKTTPKSIHWANKSHEYLRELSDWMQLCAKCHKRYDKKVK